MEVCGIQAQCRSKTKLSIKVIKETGEVSVFLSFSLRKLFCIYLPREKQLEDYAESALKAI